MTASPRPGEITYYEELGLDAAASADQIRDAFRGLARILHPDQQTDPQLKEIAETQMRKLNRIYAVLSDPIRRSAYDDSLSASRSGPIIVFSGTDGNLKKLLVRWGAFAAVCFGAFLLIWFAVDSNGTSEVRGQEARAAAGGRAPEVVDGEAGDQITLLRARIRTLETEKNSALEQLSRINRKQTDSGTLDAQLKARINEPAAEPAPEVKPSTVKSQIGAGVLPAAGPASQLAGSWIYSKGPAYASPSEKSQYPPEFIELTVTERNGALHGQYRSRYQVLDHAVSPDVEFTFSGASSGAASYFWQGSGGAKGRVAMRLIPGSLMEISWTATELGSQQWLSSGTATLARR